MSKVVFIGDSITKGTDYGGVTSTQTFAHLIGTQRGYSVIVNKGVNSDTSAGVLSRIQADVINQQPEECWMMVGVNDWFTGVSLNTYATNLQNISQAIRGAGIRFVIMSSVMRRGTLAEIQAQEGFAQVAENTLCDDFVDVFRNFGMQGWFNTHKPLYVDPVHLTVAGHSYVASIANRASHN